MALDVLSKVKKMLMMADKAGTPEEAATAAALARDLMTKYKLEEADLAISQGAEREVEQAESALLEDSGRKVASPWRIGLASALASSFGSRVYFTSRTGKIHIVGRPSDAAAVRYLHGMLC